MSAVIGTSMRAQEAMDRSRGPKVLLLRERCALCEATRLPLESEGYVVLRAKALAGALELARREVGIELLVAEDLPGDDVTGALAIAALREVIGPHLKALLIAPHISPSLRALERKGRIRLATTPVDADTLVDELRAILRS